MGLMPMRSPSEALALQALEDLLHCYDYQVEDRWCICGSDDLGRHSGTCEGQMSVRERVHIILREAKADA